MILVVISKGCGMKVFDITLGEQLILSTPDEYSMETAVAILHWLDQREGCVITNDGWQTAGYGDLVEVGIRVLLGDILFNVMCSYEEIFINRVGGKKMKFIALCEEIQSLEIETIE